MNIVTQALTGIRTIRETDLGLKSNPLRCIWVAELKGILYAEWPNFKPIPGRLKAVKEEMLRGDCIFPVKVVCDSMTGRCRIEDGRHRIIAAEELGRSQLLTEITWTEPR